MHNQSLISPFVADAHKELRNESCFPKDHQSRTYARRHIELRESDPDRAKELFLKAANRGDTRSQHFVIKELGPNDAELYVRQLYALQLEKPGWRRMFNYTYRQLQNEAQVGNKIAARDLASLYEFVGAAT